MMETEREGEREKEALRNVPQAVTFIFGKTAQVMWKLPAWYSELSILTLWSD
jgi:hypothetical protein